MTTYDKPTERVAAYEVRDDHGGPVSRLELDADAFSEREREYIERQWRNAVGFVQNGGIRE